jgi:hypothetical protein
MNYVDNLKFLNKYKIILKIEKNYRYIHLLIDWWWFKFYTISLSFGSPSKSIKMLYNL